MKKLLALLLIISTCVFCFVGCGGVTANPSGSGETGGSGNGDNKETITNGEGEVFNISSYSKILKTVLTDSYYDQLIAKGKILQTRKDQSYRTANRFQAIPYGFLESEGYDVEAIKRDELKCETDIFVLDGELYIACRVENKASIDYYTHYVIKYSMTEQELNDLNLTHKEYSDADNTTRTVSWQAPLFIQELSLQKSAIILSKLNIIKVAEQNIETHIEKDFYGNSRVDLSMFSNNISATYVKHNEPTCSSTFLFFNDISQSSEVKQSKKIAIITVSAGTNNINIIDGKKVYAFDEVSQYILQSSATEYANSKKTATFYNTYNSSFIDMEAPKYSGFYGFEKIEQ